MARDNREIALQMIPLILETVECGEPSITYGELTDRINEKHGSNLNPHFDLSGPLDELQGICSEHGAPCLSAMVVNKSTGKPGGGFLGSYERHYPAEVELDEDDILVMVLDEIRQYGDWQDFLDELGIDYVFKGSSCDSLPSSTAAKYEEYIYQKAKLIDYELAVKRDSRARRECLEKQGATCAICGFNSLVEYGIPGIIHVHHKNPLANMTDKREVDPLNDLVPLCPNCHMLVHSKKRDCQGGYKEEVVYSIEEARKIWEDAQTKKGS